MNLRKKDLDEAVTQGLISSQQAVALWDYLEARDTAEPRFSASHVAYYFGAMIVISAMGWFMTLGWEAFGGPGIFAIAAIYALAFGLIGARLWKNRSLQIPGGLLFTIAVGMVPLMIYGIEVWTGLWPHSAPDSFRDYHVYVRSSWLLMEVGTIVAGLAALWFVRFPFLTAPIAFSLWYLSMDLTPLLFGSDDYSWKERRWVSVAFGLVILLVSYLADRRTKKDFAFWGYLFGLLAFWGGLSLMDSGSEWGKFLYCLINLGLMSVSLLLDRRAFMVFGVLGVFGYLGHLSYEVFKDSLLFPFALSALGIGIIVIGILYQKMGARLQQRFLDGLPPSLKRWLPQERAKLSMVAISGHDATNQGDLSN